VWNAYWETAKKNPLDWGILFLGLLLMLAHVIGLIGRFGGRRVLFVQDLDRYQTFCLLLTELLPVLGLLGTVFSLMHTFSTFKDTAAGQTPNLSAMLNTFAPAMSTTISGLMMIGPNLVLNAILWLACPIVEKGHGDS
jgi:hypothetical protein